MPEPDTASSVPERHRSITRRPGDQPGVGQRHGGARPWRRLPAFLAGVAALTVPLLGGSASAATSTVYHWGAYFGDQNNRDDRQLSPTPIVLPGTVVQVASSNSTQYALLSNGTVYAWGMGDDGQLGDDTPGDSFTEAVKVQFPAHVTIAWLPTDAMPYNTAIAVDTTGRAWGWGLDSAGQLCLGSATKRLTPVPLPFTAKVTAAAGAGDHALYDAGGKVYACGGNQNGDLGDGTLAPSHTPAAVVNLPDSPVEALVAGFNNSGALMASGAYLDWGYDARGQLGDGVVGVSLDEPTPVSLPGPVAQVALGGSGVGNGQTLVLVTGHGGYGWGDDADGQLGDQGSGDQASPVPFSSPAGVTYVRLATGGCASYGVTASGDVYSWGCSDEGQIGNGGVATERTPVMVATGQLISSTALNVVTG